LAKKINVALIQCKICEYKKKMNLNIENLIRKCSEYSPDIVVLPERWRPIPEENIESAIQNERGSDYSFIKKLSKEYSLSIISGGIWEKRDKNEDKAAKPFITAYYFENGEEIGRQDKMHLYTYESYLFQPGDTLYLFRNSNSQAIFTILICFDLTFYETPRTSIENGAEILFSPTLIREEGLYNWKVYLQARALENRVPVTACNAVGKFFGRKFTGLSKIIKFKKGPETPVKLIVNELEKNKNDILYDEINLSFPNRIRKKRFAEKITIKNIKRKF